MEKVKFFFTHRWFKGTINTICFGLSLLLLIYNVSIIGYFALIILYGQEQGDFFYKLLSGIGILLVAIPLIFRMTKQKFYHFTLVAFHLVALAMPAIIKLVEETLKKI